MPQILEVHCSILIIILLWLNHRSHSVSLINLLYPGSTCTKSFIRTFLTYMISWSFISLLRYSIHHSNRYPTADHCIAFSSRAWVLEWHRHIFSLSVFTRAFDNGVQAGSRMIFPRLTYLMLAKEPVHTILTYQNFNWFGLLLGKTSISSSCALLSWPV